MKYRQTRDTLQRIRTAQQRYKLAAEVARQYEGVTLAAPADCLCERYRRQEELLRTKMTEARREADGLLELLGDHQTCREVIVRRYIFCETWEVIAEKMYYSVKQVMRIHDKALEIMSLNVHLQE